MTAMVLLMAMPVFAAGGSECITLTADGVASAVTCRVTAVYVARDTDGSDSVLVELWDNASAASGTRLIPPIFIDGASTSSIDGTNMPTDGVIANNGVYVDITTSGDTFVTVCYKRR